jgi:pyruvate,water dikinase
MEWAKDGLNNRLYIVQARPETIYGEDKSKFGRFTNLRRKDSLSQKESHCDKLLGKARILHNPQEANQLLEGEILVTDLTNPDWDPILKKKLAIITNKVDEPVMRPFGQRTGNLLPDVETT